METIQRKLNDSAILRWSMLLLVGFILSVNYYFYDAFSPLKSLLTSQLGFTSTDFGLFVSFYSIPNTFLLMAVLGGIILDKLGIRRTGFLFVFFMAIGAVITAYGASSSFQNGGAGYALMQSFLPQYSAELKMMLLGRFLFGLGAETSIVVISKILVKWFKGKDLALAFGIKVGFGRLGTFAALNMSPRLTQEGTQMDLAVWVAAILVVTGLLAFIVYILFDLKLDKQLNQNSTQKTAEPFSMRSLSDLLTNRTFIYVALLCVTFYSAAFPFMAYAPDFFLNKFGVSIKTSGSITSLLPLGTMIFTPLIGLFVDKKGKSASVMIIGALILTLVHLTFALTTFPPYLPMILLGVAFSLVPAAMWPTVVKLVDETKIGTAYGLMYSIQNLGLWGFPILAGMILDATNTESVNQLDYTWTILMFAGLGIIGLIFALMLKRDDKKYGYGVELPHNKK